MRFAIVTELDRETGKRRCGQRKAKRVVEHEPDDAKGRPDSTASKNGAVKC